MEEALNQIIFEESPIFDEKKGTYEVRVYISPVDDPKKKENVSNLFKKYKDKFDMLTISNSEKEHTIQEMMDHMSPLCEGKEVVWHYFGV